LSQQYSIKNLLNIKDENIHILENEVTTEEIKRIKTKVIHAKLTYNTDECPHCQAQEIIKWGTKTSDIKITKINEYKPYMSLIGDLFPTIKSWKKCLIMLFFLKMK